MGSQLGARLPERLADLTLIYMTPCCHANDALTDEDCSLVDGHCPDIELRATLPAVVIIDADSRGPVIGRVRLFEDLVTSRPCHDLECDGVALLLLESGSDLTGRPFGLTTKYELKGQFFTV